MALCFSAVVVSILAGTLSVYYVEIVGTVSQRLDDYALRSGKWLLNVYNQRGEKGLTDEIQRLVSDGIDSQDEIIIYQSRQGSVWAGNAVADLTHLQPTTDLQDLPFEQESRRFIGRVQIHDLGQDRFLIAGGDAQALVEIRHHYMKATGFAIGLAVVLSLLGALAFRRLMDKRASDIRRAIRHAGQGNLRFRIPMNRKSDEFTLLEEDINQMLEQLEQLVHGIRHVSHMVAHNLRTPLNRTLHHVHAAMHSAEALRPALLEKAQTELDQLQRLFTKMLLLAEVEAGVGQQDFLRLDLKEVLQEVLEYYEPLFKDREVSLHLNAKPGCHVRGDTHMLANALSNLFDNFLKYGVSDSSESQQRLDIRLDVQADVVQLSLRDFGNGVSEGMLHRLAEHFVRDPQHQQLPGHGLGLASVKAIVRLHHGEIRWQHGNPGLETRIRLPWAPPVT
ncbi:sensor histidine kinase [Ottowia thiooxydans]|uniref:histidine kinase n=1 Tax=Ottowia thiooxydans TaxID=219182 RepID=A0ABV2Q6N0_9BURK